MTYEEIKNLEVNESVLEEIESVILKEVKSYLSITWN